MFSKIPYNEKWAKAIAAVMIIGGIVVPVTSVLGSGQPRDNDTNSIMWGGCYTKSECITKINNGDKHHSSTNLKQIYYKEGRGITEANFKSSATVDGTVYKDGRVVVDGKTVATGAQGIGRSYMNGSHKSGSVWERPTSVSFAANSIPAYVNMEGGKFHYAVIKSCGNAVKAVAVAVKPSPTPTKTPTPTPTPKHTPTPTPTCTPSSTPTPTPTKTPTPTPTPSPTKSPTPSPTKSPTPSPTKSPVTPVTGGTGEVLGTTLPDTGPEAALGGVAGLTAIGLASRSYLRSRKSLLSSLKNRK